MVRLILRHALSRLALLRAQRERRNAKAGEEGREEKGARPVATERHKNQAGERERPKAEERKGKAESDEKQRDEG